MRKEYDLKKMKLRANPYAKKLKKSVTIRLDLDVIKYFQDLGLRTNTPYQTLVNDYLRNCKDENLKPKTVWKKSS
jgi:uncharacterized protein (DUF4415 family)